MSIAHLADSASQAGTIKTIRPSIATTIDGSGNNFAVTACAEANGDLALVAWKIPFSGESIRRVGDSGDQAGGVAHLAIAATTQHRFVTAVATATDQLKLIAWKLDLASGDLARLGDTGGSEGQASRIAMCPSPLGDGRVLVATRNGAGNLLLQNWEVTAGGALHKVGDSVLLGQPAGAISEVSVVPVLGKYAVTAVRDGGGALKLIVWAVKSDGSLKRLGDSGDQGAAISLVDVCVLAKDLVVTAVRDGGGIVRLFSWRIAADGASVTQLDDSGQAAGGSLFVACAGFVVDDVFSGLLGRVFTAVRTQTKSLKLIGWDVTFNGAIKRAEDFDDRAGPIDALAFEPLTGTYLTASRNDLDGRLCLDTWHLDAAPPPTALPNNLTLYAKSFFENTAVVVAPSAGLPKGQVVINLGQPRDKAGFVHRDLLDAAGTGFALSAAATKVSYPFAAQQRNATDNQLIRLKDKSLLAIKNGYVWSDLANPPIWFNSGPVGSLPAQARNAVFVFRSTDGGASWVQQSVIDAAVVEKGEYGWPQPDDSGNNNGAVGGFDRTDVYQDPWTGSIYVTGGGDGGPYKLVDGAAISHHAGVVFLSDDNGQTWSRLHEMPNQGKGGAPYVMTSTSAHPLVILHKWKDDPILYWREPGRSLLSGGVAVNFIENGVAVKIESDSGLSDLKGATPCIARVGPTSDGRDRVWIAHAALNANGRGVYKIGLVTFGGGKAPTSQLITTVEAEDPAGFGAGLGAFIQDDRVDGVDTNPDNLTVFQWVDAPPRTDADPDRLCVRFKIFRNVTGHTQSGYLSVSDGAKRTFPRVGIGDYFKGGYFVWNGKVHFLAQWNEAEGIQANVVSLSP